MIFFNLLAILSKRDFLDCGIVVITSFHICLNFTQFSFSEKLLN